MRKNQLKAGIVITYFTTALNMVIHLLYTPVMVRLLGQNEYGLYNLVGSIVSYLSLLGLGFTGAYLRFYSRYKSKNDTKSVENLNGMFLTIFMIMGGIALISGFTLSQFTEQIFDAKLEPWELEKAKMLMQILVINIAMTFPSSVFESFITSKEKFIFQRLSNLLGLIFNPLICLPLLLLGYKSVAIVLVTTFITLVRLLVNIYYCIVKLKVKISFHYFDFNLLKEISKFSFFIFLYMIVDQINWSIDKLILGVVGGTQEVAIYSVGAQFNSILITISLAISTVFAPRINKYVALNRHKEISDLFIKVGRIQFMIVYLIIIGFIAVGKNFIELWVGSTYSRSFYVAFFLMVPMIIDLSQNIGIEVSRAYNKHKVPAILKLVIAIMNLIISIPLAKAFGAIGSAIGTAISVLIISVILNIYYMKNIGLDIKKFWKEIFNLFKTGFATLVIAILITSNPGLDSKYYIILGLPITIMYMVFLYFKGMNSYEKGLVEKILIKLHVKH